MDSYKVVPFIGHVSTGFFSADNANTVAQQLRAAIAHEASEGWSFHSFAKVDVEVRPGCIASLFGARASTITFDQLIFQASGAHAVRSDPSLAGAVAANAHPVATHSAQAKGESTVSVAERAAEQARIAERAQGIERCQICDVRIGADARKACRDRRLCEKHLY